MAGLNLFGGGMLTSAKAGTNAAQRGYNQKVKAIKEGSQNLQKYTGKGNAALEENKSKAIDAIQAGVSQAQPYLTQATDLYSGLAPGDLSARAMYLNSLGLNGPEGNTLARDTFQNSPGFAAALEAAQTAANRAAADRGNWNSGNVLNQLQTNAQNAQNLDWNNWQNMLSNQGNNVYQDYAGQARGLTGIADLFTNQGSNIANIDTGYGTALNNNWNNLGTNLNNNNLNIGNAGYQRAQDIFGAQTSAAANQQAQNMALWNGVLGLGGDLFGAAGKAGGFGNLFG